MQIQKVGDICGCCSSKRNIKTTSDKSGPRRLERIGSNLTENKNLIVLGCSYCDSPEIFKIAQSTRKE